MADIVIIDTDILIDAGRGVSHALNYIKQHGNQITLTISIITKMELIIGCRNKNEQNEIEKFLHHFELLNLNEIISKKADELLLKYRLSHGLLIADALIAATAITWNHPLISKNQKI